MEIEKKIITDNIIILNVSGRLDAFMSNHLETTLNEVLHSGFYDIRLNFNKIDFISSAGIRLLLNYYKKLKKINGNFSIITISDNAKSTLELAGLVPLINTSLYEEFKDERKIPTIEKEGKYIEFIEKNQSDKITIELLGNPELSSNQNIHYNYTFTNNMLGLGIGELSNNSYEKEAKNAGEFLSLYGTATYLPTNASNTPDYIIEAGNLIPKLNILYGISITGDLEKQFRFNAKPRKTNTNNNFIDDSDKINISDKTNNSNKNLKNKDTISNISNNSNISNISNNSNNYNICDTNLNNSINNDNSTFTLSELLSICQKNTNHSVVAFLIIAETSGLVGASLKKNILKINPNTFFNYPDIKNNLSFSTEQQYKKCLTLTAGIFANNNCSENLKKFLRKVKPNSNIYSHSHSIIFPYIPLPKGSLDYKKIIKDIFEFSAPQNIIHLLTDNREIYGIGESEFTRGICFFSGLSEKGEND